MIPLTANECWAESAGRIHGRSCKRTAEKNIERDGQADGQAPDFGSARIDGGTEPYALYELADADRGKARRGHGCLAEKLDPERVPAYQLDPKQRAALTVFVKEGLFGPGSSAPAYQEHSAAKVLSQNVRFFGQSTSQRSRRGSNDPRKSRQ